MRANIPQPRPAGRAREKVCSTFDPSPEIWSIGRALDLGAEAFPGRPVLILVGAPILRRYQAFGNLLAAVDGLGHPLDRHPTMSRHPMTPMGEARPVA